MVSSPAETKYSQRLRPQQHAELLVLQWQPTQLRRLLDELLDLVREKLVEPMQDMEFSFDEADGWQLDAIGSRVGFRRPNVPATDIQVFGFEGSDPNVVGFDQGLFRSVHAALSPSQGLDNDRYKRLLKMHIRLLRSRYTIPELNAAVGEVIPDAVYQDHGDRTLTLYVGTEQTTEDLELFAPYWPRPATVKLNINTTVSLPIMASQDLLRITGDGGLRIGEHGRLLI